MLGKEAPLGFLLDFENGGTFALFSDICTPSVKKQIEDLLIFRGTKQILGVKSPLQRVNGNADLKESQIIWLP